MNYKIIASLPRAVLAEGRSAGIGFAFCKREGDTLTAVMPISPCKDYLNDVIYSEITGYPYQACGLHTKKEGILGEDYAFLIAKVCGSGARVEAKYGTMDSDIKTLNENFSRMQVLANSMEKDLGIKGTTEVDGGDNMVAIKCPIEWCKSTFMISLYTLALRNAPFSKGVTMETLECQLGDTYSFRSALDAYKSMVKNGIPVQSNDQLTAPHGKGIVWAWNGGITFKK
jgi:hypothetical protein